MCEFAPARHGEASARLALQVRQYDGAYPPPDVESNLESIRAWLNTGPYLHRAVITLDDELAGHVALTPIHEYLSSRLGSDKAWVEVSKLYASPFRRYHGLGGLLLESACEKAATLGLRPALAELEGTTSAIRMYHHRGWVETGSSEGDHGHNRVFILSAKPPPCHLPSDSLL